MKTQEFQELIWEFAAQHARVMPWRADPSPYKVLVSELMLQQTQVERVIPKFEMFLRSFPNIKSLAEAPLSAILIAWSGLGYNRRAKFLWQAAQKITSDFNGVVPRTKAELVSLPGVGPNTAGAILAYSFNQPVIFVETNIRTVCFNHFPGLSTDKEIILKLEQTLDQEHPREWYWALMDYGTYLKKNGHGRLSQSTHYKKQTPLKGSPREMRGWIIKALSQQGLSEADLKHTVSADERFRPALQSLLQEGLIKRTRKKIHLA